MIDKPKALSLVGETLRDIGILLIVFGPLDAFFEKDSPGLSFLVFVGVGSLSSIAVGIILEAGKRGARS